MTIQYKMIQRVTPGEKGGGKRASYPAKTNLNTINHQDFCKLMGKYVRFSNADIIAFLYALRTVLSEQILDGRIVQLKGIGSFYPRLHYQGEPDASRINHKDLKVGIGFRPHL